MKPSLILFLLFALHFQSFADAPIRMMQYNLMYYTDDYPNNCKPSGNYLNEKDANLTTIIDYVLPDVFCVCEIGSSSTYVNRVLNNVMNTNGRDYYEKCPLTNYSGGGSIANMLYYDSRKLAFHSHFYVTTYPRDINAYKMYYITENLAKGDTAFITFCIAHLKAGSYESDENSRKTQVEHFTNKLAQNGIDNYVFSGDFNLYGAEEPAYQHLLFNNNTAFRFLDPIDAYGKWHDNYQFAEVHTQSTHTYSENGCFSTGGMDDRFDFILVSPTLFYGTKQVQVLPETYHALGQDGSFFNKNLLASNNPSIPKEVIQAMYDLSDHLPVICDFEINSTTKINEYVNSFLINVENPIKNDLHLNIFAENEQLLTFELFDITGKRIDYFSERIFTGNNIISRKFDFAPSFYLLKITNEKGESRVKKMVK